MEKSFRIAAAVITVEKESKNVASVNSVLSDFSAAIIARQGLSLPHHDFNIITLVLETDIDNINALAGKLGRIPDIDIKVTLHKSFKPLN